MAGYSDELPSFLPVFEHDSSRSPLPFFRSLRSRAAALVSSTKPSSRRNFNNNAAPSYPIQLPRHNSSFLSLSRGSSDSNSTSSLPSASVTSLSDGLAKSSCHLSSPHSTQTPALRSCKSSQFLCPPTRAPSLHHEAASSSVPDLSETYVNSGVSGAQPYDLEFHATVVGSLLTSAFTEEDIDSDADADSTIEGFSSPRMSRSPIADSSCERALSASSTTSLEARTTSGENLSISDEKIVKATEAPPSLYLPPPPPYPPPQYLDNHKPKWHALAPSRSLLPIGASPSQAQSTKPSVLRTSRSALTLNCTTHHPMRSPSSPLTPHTATSETFPITPVSPLFFAPPVMVVTPEVCPSTSIPIPPAPILEKKRRPRAPSLHVPHERPLWDPDVAKRPKDWTLALDPLARVRGKSESASKKKKQRGGSLKHPRSRKDDWTLSLPQLPVHSNTPEAASTPNTVPFPRVSAELPARPARERKQSGLPFSSLIEALKKRDSSRTYVADELREEDIDWDGETVGKRRSAWSARAFA